jgi:hypothetical protein
LLRHVARLIVDHFASAARPGASARRAARRTARRRLLRFAQACRRLLRLRRVSGCLGTSRGSSRSSSSTTLRRADSSSTTPPCAGLSLTTSPSARVRVPWHIAQLVTQLVAWLVVDYFTSCRLVVDYFAYAVRPGASASRAARHAARRRQLRLRRATRCLGSSRCSSRRSSLTTPLRAGSSSITSPTPRV